MMKAQHPITNRYPKSSSPEAKPTPPENRMFSIVQAKPNSNAYCASRNLETFENFPDEAVRSNPNVHHWVDAEQVNPISAVHWIWTAGWSVGPRRLNDSMWFWFEEADGWAKIGGHQYCLKPRTLLLIPRGVEHEIVHEVGQASLYAIHFQATIYGSVNLLEMLGYPNYIAGKQHHSLLQTNSEQLAHEFAVKSPGWTRAMSLLISQVLLHILRYESASFQAPGIREMQAELPRLLPALRWMRDHLSDPEARIADMASVVNICESQFRKLFTKSMGLSPVQYMQRQRIERASSLLTATDDSIEQIAQQSGFSDVPFFYRTFKAWTLTSPGQYRRLVKSGKTR
jgi:AraC-like DNA-binding protein